MVWNSGGMQEHTPPWSSSSSFFLLLSLSLSFLLLPLTSIMRAHAWTGFFLRNKVEPNYYYPNNNSSLVFSNSFFQVYMLEEEHECGPEQWWNARTYSSLVFFLFLSSSLFLSFFSSLAIDLNYAWTWFFFFERKKAKPNYYYSKDKRWEIQLEISSGPPYRSDIWDLAYDASLWVHWLPFLEVNLKMHLAKQEAGAL